MLCEQVVWESLLEESARTTQGEVMLCDGLLMYTHPRWRKVVLLLLL